MIAAVQRRLRSVYLHAEALFNRAFGDRGNPLYHLGAISFFLFWVVGATGVVLYAFFDTSVGGAWASVQRLTDGGFGSGRVLRTVHRHASDAMLVTMLLHLARCWAFDKLRGFRAFSWLTGVGLLWLAYIAAANGYMLPWDQLAQFVTQTTFEWFDQLPGFGGTLSRNFIGDAHVSDRLFSLLVFIHIGVPLGMLLLMWVHVQRVPKAALHPPQAIVAALLGMLVLLALLAPVSSHAPAHLDQVPGLLRMDWFVLPVLALLGHWSPLAVWALVGGATAALALLPWLPPRRAGQGTQLTLHPGALRVSARAGETLLEAGLRGGALLPFDCRAGGCGLCVCTVLNGRVDLGPVQDSALTPAMRARGQALMCCAVALEDVELEVPGVPTLRADTALAVQRLTARIATMERLSQDLMRLFLQLPEGAHLAFTAGQYLNIVLDDGARRAFSFAQAPADTALTPSTAGDRIELHVRWIPGGRFTTQVFESLQVGDTLEIEGPLGRFALHDSERPILFVAGATGFAPVKSILEDAFRRGIRRPMQLYWGVRHADDLYLQDTLAQWQREHAQFRYVPVVSQDEASHGWTGRRGLVHEALLADHPDLRGYDVYACGSVRMVQAAVPDFIAHGLPEQFCFSDAFVPTVAVPSVVASSGPA